MTRPKSPEVDVFYLDGRTERVTFRASVMVAMERRFRVGVVPQIESSLYGAWFALHKPGNGADDDARFDDWLDGVDVVKDAPEVEGEAVDVDAPTEPGPTPG